MIASSTPDEGLSAVLIGPPVGGYMALWGEGDVSFWRLPGSLPSMLAAGAMVRVGDETGRYRELGFLHRETGLLVLRDRDPGPLGTPISQVVPITPATMEEAKAESVRDGVSVAQWLAHATHAAVTGGEWVAVHRGSWQSPFEPIVVVELQRDERGEWRCAVRATPVPTGAAFWSDHAVAPGSERQQVTAPAGDEAIRLSGALIAAAFLAWGIHPLMLGMRFGPNPLGPPKPLRPWSESDR